MLAISDQVQLLGYSKLESRVFTTRCEIGDILDPSGRADSKMVQKFNLMRLLRIQLKMGYIDKEPVSYTFMKRYPPMMRDTVTPIRKVEVNSIPYLRLYEDALEKNPKFMDERVYPAYWQQEPLALTLAKKQYELMKKGMSEKDAYVGALEYTDQLEGKAYDEMKNIIEKSGDKGFLKPLKSDPVFDKSMKKFGTLFSEIEYEDLDLRDQGEIDYILQTKVLKWNEVERERRMKDPEFVIQFKNLLKATFPKKSKIAVLREPFERAITKSTLMEFFNVSDTRLCTNEPFYYDDYLYYFQRAQEEPLLGRWNIRDRQNFSRWITDTLAIREIVERSLTSVVQRYLDDLRAQFFPMIRYPDRAQSFNLPSTDDLKALLYANDVGYKRKDQRLFVQRVHKLPLLLFPKETFTTALLTDRKKLIDIIDSDNTMIELVRDAGLELSSIEELRTQLKQYSGGNNSRRSQHAANLNMSALDKLVSQYDDDEYDAEPTVEESVVELNPSTDEPRDLEEQRSNAEFYKFINGRMRDEMSQEEWDLVVREYYRQPATDLERTRESHLGSEKMRIMRAKSEIGLKTIKDEMQQNDMIVRSRLSHDYEMKETARRAASWDEREIFNDLPRPAFHLES